jgi:hypothetical protein
MGYMPDRAWESEPDIVADEGRRGLLRRLLGVADSGSPLSLALLVGALGAAAFVASMAYSWERVLLDLTPLGNGTFERTSSTFDLAPTSVDGLGTVYVWVMIGLLATIGAAVAWPQSAARLRVLATGVGVGAVGILIALTVRLPQAFISQQGVPVEGQAQLKVNTTHEPGVYFAFAAVVLCVAAIWLAGPLRRSSTATRVPAQPSTMDIQPRAYEVTVTAAEPIDHAVHPGDPWRRGGA